MISVPSVETIDYLIPDNIGFKPNFSEYNCFDETLLAKFGTNLAQFTEWSPPILDGNTCFLTIVTTRNMISLYLPPKSSFQTSFEKYLDLNEILFENLMEEEEEEKEEEIIEIKTTPKSTGKRKSEKSLLLEKIFLHFWDAFVSNMPGNYLTEILPVLQVNLQKYNFSRKKRQGERMMKKLMQQTKQWLQLLKN
jgi:hypothetical protein